MLLTSRLHILSSAVNRRFWDRSGHIRRETASGAAARDGKSGRERWRARVSTLAGGALAVVFLVSGVWKLLDLGAAAERMVQALIPGTLGAPVALAVAVCETVAGILLLVPRYRRWGAILSGLMLVAFMLYIGALYDRLLGDDCNCFPWIRRAVGPAFFASDAAMLALAMIAGWLSERSHGWRGAVSILSAILLVGAGAQAGAWIRHTRVEAPAVVSVDDRPFALREGRVLLYFFDPECTHCYTVAREMSRRNWGTTRVIVVPVREAQFATVFLSDTGLRAGVSSDGATLRGAFAFTEPPYAVALNDGRTVARFNWGQMEDRSWYLQLEGLGYVR